MPGLELHFFLGRDSSLLALTLPSTLPPRLMRICDTEYGGVTYRTRS